MENMSYENLKKELTTVVQEHYQGGTLINDIRAAFHAVDLMAEKVLLLDVLREGDAELWKIAHALATHNVKISGERSESAALPGCAARILEK